MHYGIKLACICGLLGSCGNKKGGATVRDMELCVISVISTSTDSYSEYVFTVEKLLLFDVTFRNQIPTSKTGIHLLKGTAMPMQASMSYGEKFIYQLYSLCDTKNRLTVNGWSPRWQKRRLPFYLRSSVRPTPLFHRSNNQRKNMCCCGRLIRGPCPCCYSAIIPKVVWESIIINIHIDRITKTKSTTWLMMNQKKLWLLKKSLPRRKSPKWKSKWVSWMPWKRYVSFVVAVK